MSTSVRDWVETQQINGVTTFSFEEAVNSLPNLSSGNIMTSLSRLAKDHLISPVQKRFYVITPPTNRGDGIVPPYYYIDNLMRKIGRDYYVGLLSAASLHGAAHQAVMTCNIVLPYPKISFSSRRNNQITWHYRPNIPKDFLEDRRTETGYIKVSNPELTALDLVQYSQHSGGLSHVATVLAELAEKLDFSRNDGRVLAHTTGATIQRLGYILEEVLNLRDKADMLCEFWHLHYKRAQHAPLSSQSTAEPFSRNEHWKIDVNTSLEVDDL